jgi:uncharacterized protein with GYD domain
MIRPQSPFSSEASMMFIVSINWTEQGIRTIKDWPKRVQAARDLGKKVGVEIKQIFLTTGEHDMVALVETANADNIAKFAMAMGMVGNIRTKTARAWPEAEFVKLLGELP